MSSYFAQKFTPRPIRLIRLFSPSLLSMSAFFFFFFLAYRHPINHSQVCFSATSRSFTFQSSSTQPVQTALQLLYCLFLRVEVWMKVVIKATFWCPCWRHFSSLAFFKGCEQKLYFYPRGNADIEAGKRLRSSMSGRYESLWGCFSQSEARGKSLRGKGAFSMLIENANAYFYCETSNKSSILILKIKCQKFNSIRFPLAAEMKS